MTRTFYLRLIPEVMKEVFAPIIHERSLLMARTETDALCQCPELGEDIYQAWTQTMDVSNPDDFELTDYINELADRYKVNHALVSEIFETIRLIIVQYDALIDSV